MSIIGDQISSVPSNGYITVDSTGNNQIATNGSKTYVITNPGWLQKVGAWLQAASGTPKVYFGVWATDAAGQPTDRLAYTEQVIVSGTAANHEGDLIWTSTEVDTALRTAAGLIVTLGLVVTDGSVKVAIAGSGLVPYYRTAVGPSIPNSPFNPSETGLNALAFYTDFLINHAPNAPTINSPADDITVQDFTPAFSLSFSDPDTVSPTFDQADAVEIDVRSQDLVTVYWSGQTAFSYLNDDEQEEGNVVRTYLGTTLTGGEDLRWRSRFFDLSGQPGAWSAWYDLAIGEGPLITLTQPSGKKDGPTEDIAWAGTYAWDDGPTEAFQFRVYKGSVIFRESAEISKVVADGASWTATGAETGLGYLGAGIDFEGSVRAKQGGIWGDWSNRVAFHTNAIPTTPTRLQPPGGSESSTYPTVRFSTFDPDDAMGSEVHGFLEITNPNGSITEVEITAYDSVRREFYMTMSSGEMPDEGTYLFRARAEDLSASDGSSDWSDYIAFDLVAGLGVTIISPTEQQVLTDSSPTFVVSITGGSVAFARIIIYEANTETVRYDSGVFVWNSTTMPEITDGVVLNGRSYDAVIWIQNNADVSGQSNRRRFSVSYNAPQELSNASVTLYRYPRDPEPTAAQFNFPRANVPVDRFGAYIIRRRNSGERFEDAKIIKRIDNIQQNSWADPFAPADKTQIYSVSYTDKSGKESARVEASIDIPLSVIVVQSTIDPNLRGILRWKPAQRRGVPKNNMTLYQPWGTGGKSIAMYGAGYSEAMEGTFRILGDTMADRETHFQALYDLWKSKHPVQWKEERLSFFGIISNFEWDAYDFTDSVKIAVQETLFIEGKQDANFVLRPDGTYVVVHQEWGPD